jgi:hypothetical protein
MFTTVDTIRAEALFASTLQPSDRPHPTQRTRWTARATNPHPGRSLCPAPDQRNNEDKQIDTFELRRIVQSLSILEY